MKTNIFMTLSALVLIGWYGCKEEEHLSYPDTDAAIPGQVHDVKWESIPGGAIVTYKLPEDKSLSYVKAVYEIQPGVYREAKSSSYQDSLYLVGFGDTTEYKVNIYSVGRNEKESAPITVNVRPDLPPVKSAFKTLTLDVTFGGVQITYKNEAQADLAIFVMADTTGNREWFQLAPHFTSSLEGNFAIRDMEAKAADFGIYIRDRWNNKSDTLVKNLTPLFEEPIPYSNFKLVSLPSDKNKGQGTNSVDRLFDGKVGAGDTWYKSEDDTYPQWFTMDMQQPVVFGRMRLFQCIGYPYVPDWVKDFEIWGSNELVDDWDKWILLGHFESFKPSGLPDPTYTAEDMEYERAGEDYSFPVGIPAVRYMRFKVLTIRGGGGKFYSLNELSFWGQIVK
ncbi:MAG: DUF4959 domain-containing protein [Tannerella sp.]|jgi:hypothetical protein|nr:DUF4959 domain-containing protein [Tannerella sp.]